PARLGGSLRRLGRAPFFLWTRSYSGAGAARARARVVAPVLVLALQGRGARRGSAPKGGDPGRPRLLHALGGLVLAGLEGLLGVLPVGPAGRLGRVAWVDLAGVGGARGGGGRCRPDGTPPLSPAPARGGGGRRRRPPPGPPRGAGAGGSPAPPPPPLPPLSAKDTAARPTAVMPAANSESPSGPSLIVMP